MDDEVKYNFQKGDICVHLGVNGDRYIIKVRDEGYCDEYISSGGTFHRSGGGCGSRRVPATPEEKQWLEACIAAGETIPREQAVPTIINSYSII